MKSATTEEFFFLAQVNSCMGGGGGRGLLYLELYQRNTKGNDEEIGIKGRVSFRAISVPVVIKYLRFIWCTLRFCLLVRVLPHSPLITSKAEPVDSLSAKVPKLIMYKSNLNPFHSTCFFFFF